MNYPFNTWFTTSQEISQQSICRWAVLTGLLLGQTTHSVRSTLKTLLIQRVFRAKVLLAIVFSQYSWGCVIRTFGPMTRTTASVQRALLYSQKPNSRDSTSSQESASAHGLYGHWASFCINTSGGGGVLKELLYSAGTLLYEQVQVSKVRGHIEWPTKSLTCIRVWYSEKILSFMAIKCTSYKIKTNPKSIFGWTFPLSKCYHVVISDTLPCSQKYQFCHHLPHLSNMTYIICGTQN